MCCSDGCWISVQQSVDINHSLQAHSTEFLKVECGHVCLQVDSFTQFTSVHISTTVQFSSVQFSSVQFSSHQYTSVQFPVVFSCVESNRPLAMFGTPIVWVHHIHMGHTVLCVSHGLSNRERYSEAVCVFLMDSDNR